MEINLVQQTRRYWVTLAALICLQSCAHREVKPRGATNNNAQAQGSSTSSETEQKFKLPTFRGVVNDAVCAFNLLGLFYHSTPAGSSRPSNLGNTFFTCAAE